MRTTTQSAEITRADLDAFDHGTVPPQVPAVSEDSTIEGLYRAEVAAYYLLDIDWLNAQSLFREMKEHA